MQPSPTQQHHIFYNQSSLSFKFRLIQLCTAWFAGKKTFASVCFFLAALWENLLLRQWQAVFVCLFLQCSCTAEWLVTPQCPGWVIITAFFWFFSTINVDSSVFKYINLQSPHHFKMITLWLHVFITLNIIHQAKSGAECGSCGTKWDGIFPTRPRCLGEKSAACCSSSCCHSVADGSICSSAKLHVHTS